MTKEFKWHTRKYLFNTKEGKKWKNRETQKGDIETKSKVADINLTLSVITSNINKHSHQKSVIGRIN